MTKFLLNPSESTSGWWILSAPEYGLTIRFREHEFNETQEVSLNDQSIAKELGAEGVATLMREAGDYLFTHAYSVAMPTPVYELRVTGDDIYILRNTPPKLKIKIEDNCTNKELVEALTKAAEFIRKRSK